MRERKEDILLLANHFLSKYADRIGKPAPHLSPEVIGRLMQFNWPGNVRELENEMERTLAMAAGSGQIGREFLSEKLLGMTAGNHAKTTGFTSGVLKDVVRQVEEQMVRETLARTDGNRSKAAKLLGLSRQGLLNKIAAYHVRD